MRQLSFEVCPEAAPLSSAPSGSAVEQPRGSMTEVIVSEGSALQPFQLLPALALCNDHQRWLMWLSPNQAMNKQWLVKAGLGNSPVLHMSTQINSQFDLCVKALRSGKSHLIVEWSGALSASIRSALRQMAENTGSHLFLVRGE